MALSINTGQWCKIMQEKQSNESNNGRNYIILKKFFKMLKDIFRVK